MMNWVNKITSCGVIAALTMLVSSSLSASQVHISGRVFSELGQPISNSTVDINASTASLDATGQFTLTLDPADIYTARYQADGFYPMIHSYSAHELSWNQHEETTNLLVVPDVQLVERTETRVMLAFGGDTMMDRRYLRPLKGEPVLVDSTDTATDAAALLKHIGPYLKLADYTSLNLETPVFDKELPEHAAKSVVFQTPSALLGALTSQGVDYVSLGNNHTYDYLEPGLKATLESLQASGLAYSGAGMTEIDALRGHQVSINGNQLSFLGYVGWAGGSDPNQVAQGTDKGGAALGSETNIQNSVTGELEQGFAPVIQYHGSLEYSNGPTLATESRLKQAIDQGAVLALGHHPHVAQGFELYKDKLIAYSLGNFLFDQYFHATQFSFLLYVWMDDGQFHRAEIVPLHIKGYVPVPATDTSRQSILKRVRDLSAQRGLYLQASGGNAVIKPNDQTNVTVTDQSFPVPTNWQNQAVSIHALNERSWLEAINEVSTSSGPPLQFKLGRNLLPTGHFESFGFYAALDRTWISDSMQDIVRSEDAPSGANVLRLKLATGDQEGLVGMRTFERTYKPGTPTSIVTSIKADEPMEITAYLQLRKKRQNRLVALESAAMIAIGTQSIQPTDWQQLRFDFDTPRVGTMSYRFVMKVSRKDTANYATILFDDIALVEWFSPPMSAGELPNHIPAIQASHISVHYDK